MTDFVDFGDVHKLFLGNTEITFLQRGSNLLWKSAAPGIENIAFPAHLFNAWSRAFDPYEDPTDPNIYTSDSGGSSNVAVLGDTVNRWDTVGGFNVGSGNTAIASTSSRLIANSSVGSGPQFVEHVGRRAMKFNGANNYLYRVNSPINFDSFNMITIGAMIYVDTVAGTGTFIDLTRGEYGGSRTDIQLNISADGANNYINYRFRMDSTIYSDSLYNKDKAAWVLKPGWQMIWFEFDASKGNTSTDGFISGFYGNDNTVDEPIAINYGDQATDVALNRLAIGAQPQGSSVNKFFNGYIGRFFVAFKKFTSSEREVIMQWLQGTARVSYVNPRPADTWFPYDIVANTYSWALDPYDPSNMQTYTANGAPVSNNEVGLSRLITSGVIGNSNTAIEGGVILRQYESNNRMRITTSWENDATNGDRRAFTFNGANSFLEAANGISYPSIAAGSFPQTRYDYGYFRIDPGVVAANDAMGITPFHIFNASAPANNFVKPFWMDTKVLGSREAHETSNIANTHSYDVNKRISSGWTWVEAITTITGSGENGQETSIYMNGDLWANVVCNTNISSPLPYTNILFGANWSGSANENFGQASLQVGRSGSMNKNPTEEDRARIFTWAQAKSYVGIPFPIDYMENPFTAFGAAYDPYNLASLSNTNIGDTITLWNPTYLNNVRTDGTGTSTMALSTTGSPSANAPILSSESGFNMLNHNDTRLLIANTTGMDMKISMAFSCGGLLLVDNGVDGNNRGIPWHHYRENVGNNFRAYIGLTEIFVNNINNFPYMKMTSNTSGGGNNNIISSGGSPYITPYAARHSTDIQFYSYIHSVTVSANSGATAVNMKTWLNGVKILDYSNTVEPWAADDYAKMTRYVVGAQLRDGGTLTANKNWNSYTGRNFWFEQAITSEADVQLLNHWLYGHGYTPVGS